MGVLEFKNKLHDTKLYLDRVAKNFSVQLEQYRQIIRFVRSQYIYGHQLHLRLLATNFKQF